MLTAWWPVTAKVQFEKSEASKHFSQTSSKEDTVSAVSRTRAERRERTRAELDAGRQGKSTVEGEQRTAKYARGRCVMRLGHPTDGEVSQSVVDVTGNSSGLVWSRALAQCGCGKEKSRR